MTTIGVIYKKEDSLIAGTAQQVIKELKKMGYKLDLARARFVLTFGGDGTILRAARILAKSKTPILGVHLGGLGFLSEIELHELSDALERIKKGKFIIDERAMLEAMLGGRKLIALNDIVISNSGIARVIKLEVKGVAEYTSDGIIFSTATGSTAYNLSAGGPLLTPDSQSMVISAISPHSISTRPLVLEKPVTAVLIRGKEAILTADGQHLVPLHETQKIRIYKSKFKTRFIRLKEYNFFERVKNVFGFGPRT
ncbi:MAG: NAD(+)/NADH kinase [Candidatus Margulisiibacteriota bacterium]